MGLLYSNSLWKWSYLELFYNMHVLSKDSLTPSRIKHRTDKFLRNGKRPRREVSFLDIMDRCTFLTTEKLP
jgi:hypothetical protein